MWSLVMALRRLHVYLKLDSSGETATSVCDITTMTLLQTTNCFSLGYHCTRQRTAEYVLRCTFTTMLDAHFLKTITNAGGVSSDAVSPIADHFPNVLSNLLSNVLARLMYRLMWSNAGHCYTKSPQIILLSAMSTKSICFI